MGVIQLLIEGGASATAQDKDGHNPLHLAAGSKSFPAMEVARVFIETQMQRRRTRMGAPHYIRHYPKDVRVFQGSLTGMGQCPHNLLWISFLDTLAARYCIVLLLVQSAHLCRPASLSLYHSNIESTTSAGLSRKKGVQQ